MYNRIMRKQKFVTVTINVDNKTYAFLKQMAKETGNTIEQNIRFILWQHVRQEKCRV